MHERGTEMTVTIRTEMFSIECECGGCFVNPQTYGFSFTAGNIEDGTLINCNDCSKSITYSEPKPTSIRKTAMGKGN